MLPKGSAKKSVSKSKLCFQRIATLGIRWALLAPGFTVMAFCEGRLASGTPTWLVGCHTLSLAGSPPLD